MTHLPKFENNTPEARVAHALLYGKRPADVDVEAVLRSLESARGTIAAFVEGEPLEAQA